MVCSHFSHLNNYCSSINKDIMSKRHEINPKNLRIALGLSGVHANEDTCELIVAVIKGMENLGGSFSLMDAANIQSTVEMAQKARYDKEIEIRGGQTTELLLRKILVELEKQGSVK